MIIGHPKDVAVRPVNRTPARSVAVLLFALLIAVPVSAAARMQPPDPPWIEQKTPTDCGRAVLASLAARRGGDPEAMYRRIPDPEDKTQGYSVAEMLRYGSRLGVKLVLEAPSGVTKAGFCAPRQSNDDFLARLRREITAGRPVIVPVAMDAARRHYLLLLASGVNEFIALDPASRGRRTLSSAELHTLMCGFAFIALIVR